MEILYPWPNVIETFYSYFLRIIRLWFKLLQESKNQKGKLFSENQNSEESNIKVYELDHPLVHELVIVEYQLAYLNAVLPGTD